MTAKLHTVPISPHCRKIMALVSHLKLPVEMVYQPPGQFAQDDTLKALNPNVKVPTLEDGDTSVWESAVIMQHLAANHGSDLWPSDPAEQREVLKWQFWETSALSPAMLAVYFERIVKNIFGMGDEDPAVVEAKMVDVNRFLGVLDQQLESHKYVASDKLSLADFSVGAIVSSAEMSKIDLSGFKHVTKWLQDLLALPGMDELPPLPESKLMMAAAE